MMPVFLLHQSFFKFVDKIKNTRNNSATFQMECSSRIDGEWIASCPRLENTRVAVSTVRNAGKFPKGKF
jgi:hypothetical protein